MVVIDENKIVLGRIKSVVETSFNTSIHTHKTLEKFHDETIISVGYHRVFKWSATKNSILG